MIKRALSKKQQMDANKRRSKHYFVKYIQAHKITLKKVVSVLGYVQQIADDHFVISDSSRATTIVAYAQVKQVKQVKDRRLSDGKLTVIGVTAFIVLYTWANLTNKPWGRGIFLTALFLKT